MVTHVGHGRVSTGKATPPSSSPHFSDAQIWVPILCRKPSDDNINMNISLISHKIRSENKFPVHAAAVLTIKNKRCYVLKSLRPFAIAHEALIPVPAAPTLSLGKKLTH